MIRTVEVIVDEHGRVHPTERVGAGEKRRALLTILEEPPVESAQTAMISEAALARDWNREEEDAAWSHLQ